MARLRAPQIRGTFLSLAAGVAFSVSPILIQVAYSHGAAVSGVLAWRYLAAALLLVGLAGRRMLSVPLRAAFGAFVLGAIVYALDSALFFGALERTSAPLASLVHYAHLVLVVGVAAMIGRERLTRRRMLALVGIFGGVALVGGAAVNPDLIGVGMALGAGAAYAVYILLSDRLLRDADPLALAAYLTAGAATSFLVVGGALGSLGTVGGSSGLICLVVAALVGSVFAVTSFLEGVRLVGPSTASLLVTVEVPVTIALAAIVLKQHLTPTQFLGAGVVVAAIVAMQLRSKPKLRLVPADPRSAAAPARARRATRRLALNAREPNAPRLGIWPLIFDSTSSAAERRASFAAAITMSASISGSSGSIARGSIVISTSSPPPFALTVTMPPPADASTISSFASSWASSIWACISWACLSIAFMSNFGISAPPLPRRRMCP